TPRLFGLVLIAPLLQMAMLGYAATTDVKHVPIVIVDGDRSPMSRELIEHFAVSPNFMIVGERFNPADVDDDLAHGRACLALVIPKAFGAALAAHPPHSALLL